MASTVWRGFITFGLISIPVKVARAARAERVKLRRLYRAEAPNHRGVSEEEPEQERDSTEEGTEPPKGSPFQPSPRVLAPVQHVSVRQGSDEVLDTGSVVKGFEYEKDRYVSIDPEVLKSIVPKTTTEMSIEEFVKLAEIDPVYFETSYYVAPEKAGENAYALLYRSMQLTGLVAVAQFAMHSREHIVILRPASKGLIAHTMFFASEVRADEEYSVDIGTVKQKELDLAQTLIHSLAASFEPNKYRDSYREKLESIIAARVVDQPIATAEPSHRKAVTDITEALQKSLAALKKPAASERQSSKTSMGSGTPRKKSARRAG